MVTAHPFTTLQPDHLLRRDALIEMPWVYVVDCSTRTLPHDPAIGADILLQDVYPLLAHRGDAGRSEASHQGMTSIFTTSSFCSSLMRS